jgi:hypothetical protein
MVRATWDRCLVCGRPKAAAHHPAGRANLPVLVVDLCDGHHDHLDERLRAAGVPLGHRRRPSEAEIIYAVITGMVSLFAELTEPIGAYGAQRAKTIERLALGVRRLILLVVPASERSFGPTPIRHAQTKQTPRARRLAAATPADPVDQIERLFSLIAHAAEATLGSDPRQRTFLDELGLAAANVGAAARRLNQLADDQVGNLIEALRPALAAMAELAEVVCTLDLHEPDPAEAERGRAAVAGLASLERRTFRVLLELAEAEDETMTQLAIASFLSTNDA